MAGHRRDLLASVVIVVIVVAGSVMGIVAPHAVSGFGARAPTTAAAAAPTASSPAVAPASGVTTSAGSAALSSIAANSLDARAVAASRAAGVPLRYVYLPAPELGTGPKPLGPDGIVTPSYTSAPAPIGVAYYGLYNNSGTPAATVTNSTSVEGVLTDYNITPLSVAAGAPDYFGTQLNAVVTNVDLFGTYGYEFWTQNVVDYSTYGHQLQFIDNVWNFSAPNANLSSNVFAAHGATGVQVGTEYYYAIGPLVTVTAPFTLSLFLNTVVLPSGDQAVYFNYTLVNGTLSLSGTYDYVEFNSTGGGHAAASPSLFQANGTGYNPTGYLPNDWEMVLGGPGGGSNADLLNTAADLSLYYWTGSAYASVPSAYNFGGDTGETAIGATAGWYANGGYPYEWLSTGPTWPEGLWNISGGYGHGYTQLYADYTPTNAFAFIAPGIQSLPSAEPNFSWSPQPQPGTPIYFPGTVTHVSVTLVLADYDGGSLTTVTNSTISPSMTPNLAEGVYTPLWAFNTSQLNAITYNGVELIANSFGQIGHYPTGPSGIQFYWFGLVNDFDFQVFPGVFIANEAHVVLAGSPSFTVTLPPWQDAVATFYGLPTTNQLMVYFYNDTYVALSGSTFSGWWYAHAYFGGTASQANVVFWNTSYALIYNNTFATGTDGLFLYGGAFNQIWNNTFTVSYPTVIPNPSAIAGLVYGTTGLTEEDYYDAVFNNIFLTYYTAVNPLYDPYASTFETSYYGYFYETWNITPTSALGPNIIGGSEWGGNYWWNYGTALDPFGVPYDAGTNIAWGVDYHPLWPSGLFRVTFQESGLPVGAAWAVDTNDPTGGLITNSSTSLETNQTWSNGTYTFAATAVGYVQLAPFTFTVAGGNLVVAVAFTQAVNLEIVASGLPSGAHWGAEAYSTVTTLYYYNTSTTANLNLTVVNGTTDWYAYLANLGAQEYAAYPTTQGTVTVAGLTVVDVAYVPLYNLTFSVTGLAAGAVWTSVIYGGPLGNYGEFSQAASFSFSHILTGTYAWTIYAAGYTASPANGTVSLTSDKTVAVTFAASRTVTFTETGLDSGAAWSVWFTQGAKTVQVSGTGSTLTVNAVVGAYNYTVRADGYSAAPANGSGTLGANSSVAVALSKNPGPTTTFLGLASMDWGLLAFAFIALAIVGLALAALFRGRSKKPAEMTPYNPAPAGAAAAPPPAPAGAPAPPAWKEDEPATGAPPPK